MSVWEENFGRKTEGKGAGSRSAWQFDLLWRIICCASVPQPHLKRISPVNAWVDDFNDTIQNSACRHLLADSDL